MKNDFFRFLKKRRKRNNQNQQDQANAKAFSLIEDVLSILIPMLFLLFWYTALTANG